ncbi:hypothetical protein DFH08DRAFT_839579 [Mycena albidolilacea]|uniref:Rhodopsin domain-containing protein n=1 Tax=Mycena albidolilacea TaxID=1033008 RepID=A0AAD7F1T2_9AGAR|nr:hypothetical protein DFH08DRAFT_839579 [Mycena albidolilacea]
MVVWAQPTNTTKRIVTTTLLGIAMLTTLFRLRTRIRTRRFWLDDVWAIVALIFSIMLLVSMWLRTIPSSSKHTLIVTYWILSFGFTSTLWASRMSVIFSVVRVIPHDSRSKLRKITNCFAAIFAVFWIGLMIQVASVCGLDKSWYKLAKPQCHLGDGVAAFELTSDIFADVTLAILPIVLTRNSLVPSAQRKMLYVIFAASLLTTIASIVHAILLLGPSGSLEGIAAHAEAATALIVANAGVLVTSVYRVVHKNDDIDTMPYTYNYSIHTTSKAAPSDGSASLDGTETDDEKSIGKIDRE